MSAEVSLGTHQNIRMNVVVYSSVCQRHKGGMGGKEHMGFLLCKDCKGGMGGKESKGSLLLYMGCKGDSQHILQLLF